MHGGLWAGGAGVSALMGKDFGREGRLPSLIELHRHPALVGIIEHFSSPMPSRCARMPAVRPVIRPMLAVPCLQNASLMFQSPVTSARRSITRRHRFVRSLGFRK